MKKRKLHTITKRIAKTILMQCEPHVMLNSSRLTSEEIDYINDYIKVVGEKITSLDQGCDINEIVEEEYSK